MRSLQGLLHLHRLRLRAHAVSTLLAVVGIAAGVALVFAVLVANTSITRSLGAMNEAIAGSATLELAARSPEGFDARLLRRVERLPAVRRAAPLVQLRGRLSQPGSAAAVTFVGVDQRVPALGGSLLRKFSSPALFALRGVGLTAPLARRLDVGPGDRVTLSLGARKVRPTLLTVYSAADIGRLADSSIAVAPLRYAQEISGMQGQLNRILVAPAAGRERAAVRQLRAVVGPGIAVRASDSEFRLLEQAGGLYSQSTVLFAFVSALVGFLFALNAMLLGAPERRRLIAYLRVQGYDDRAVLKLLLLEGLTLGVAASALGLLLGDQLSRHAFGSTPGYVSFAFPVGDLRVVTVGAVAVAVAAGIGAALLASMAPLASVFSRRPIDAPFREREEFRTRLLGTPALLAIAAPLLVATALILILVPAAAIAATALLVVAMLVVIPALLQPTLRVLQRASFRSRFPMLVVAIGELRYSLVRSTALAATAALAVFGCVQTGGARQDLLRGLDESGDTFVATADVWVTAGGDENALTTNQFSPRAGQLAALRRDDAVADVRLYRGDFLDLAGRRAWVIARPSDESALIPAAQLVEGDLEQANRRLRAGGWVALSEAIADRLGVTTGESVTLPTPSGPARFRLAATVTNFGWAPGAVVLNADDYASSWRTTAVAALEVDLAPRVDPEHGAGAVANALGPASPLTVETAAERGERFRRLARQGLDRLSQIFTLLLVAAVLALAAAMGGVLWQRRARLAALKAQGFPDAQVWRALVLETGILLASGCLIGGTFGVYGQAIGVRWLEAGTGFPVQYAPAVPLALAIVFGVALVATVVTGLPGYLAARVPAAFGFQEGAPRSA